MLILGPFILKSVITFLLAAGFAGETGPAFLRAVEARLSRIHSLKVTLTTTYPANKRTVVERYAAMKGGYLRYEQSEYVALISPKASWLLWPKAKQYVLKQPPPKGSQQNPLIGMPGLFGESDMPAIGNVESVTWHGHQAYKLTMDARLHVSKHARLVYYFDRKTKLPLGFHANPGSTDADGIYSDLKIDPPLRSKDFEFKPPSDWTSGSPR